MRFRHCCRRLGFSLLPVLLLTGCVFRTRVVAPKASTANLLSSTQAHLLELVNDHAEKIKSLNATVDIATSVGGEKKGTVTDYKEIRGYILVRQPDMLRLIGLLPVIRNRAFDMVTDGQSFKLWIPPVNKFYMGRNDVVPPGATGLSAMRPQVFYDALLLNGIGPDEIAVMESGSEFVTDPKKHKQVEQPDYRIDVIRRGPKGWYMARSINFDRVDLQPDRQDFYDTNGNLTSEDRYDQWKQYGGVWFPNLIQIWQPEGEYQLTVAMVKLTVNESVTDEQFALEQPPGAQVIHLDGNNMTASDGKP